MEKLKYQVEKDELKNPACVKTIHKDKAGGEAKAKQIEAETTKYLNNLGIRFAKEEQDSTIDIFIEADLLEE